MHPTWQPRRPTAVPGGAGDASMCNQQGSPGVDQASAEAQVECPLAALPRVPAPRKPSEHMPCTSASRVGCPTSNPMEQDIKQEMGKNTVGDSSQGHLNFSQQAFLWARESITVMKCDLCFCSKEPNHPPPGLMGGRSVSIFCCVIFIFVANSATTHFLYWVSLLNGLSTNYYYLILFIDTTSSHGT